MEMVAAVCAKLRQGLAALRLKCPMERCVMNASSAYQIALFVPMLP